MENFTPISATLGGLLIGISASIMLIMNGKIAGISGIVGGLFRWPVSKAGQPVAFLLGLLAGGLLLNQFHPEPWDAVIPRSSNALIVAGLLVGFGTRLGSGCTSGHGVCGISRMSKRSIVATMVFMAFGFLSVAVVHFFMGGQI